MTCNSPSPIIESSEDPRDTSEASAVKTSEEDLVPHPVGHALPVEYRELPKLTRIILLVVGSGLLMIGFIGLLLPVFPQTLPLAAGTALLTLGSNTVHRFVHRRLSRWPRIQKLVIKTENRLHGWVKPRN